MRLSRSKGVFQSNEIQAGKTNDQKTTLADILMLFRYYLDNYFVKIKLCKYNKLEYCMIEYMYIQTN